MKLQLILLDDLFYRGTPRLGGEELEIMTDSNYYEPMYMDIDELKNKNFQRMDVVNKAINKKYE